jgi:hypothetical protein
MEIASTGSYIQRPLTIADISQQGGQFAADHS